MQNLTIGISNPDPLVLTTSILSNSDIDDILFEKVKNSDELTKYCLKISKHEYNPDNNLDNDNVFFAYDVTETDSNGLKLNLRPITDLFKHNADEETFTQVFMSFVDAIACVEKLGISFNSVYIMPKEIFITKSNTVKLLFLPFKEHNSIDYPDFIREFFDLLPFTPSNNKLLMIKDYFSNHNANYSFVSLQTMLNTDTLVSDPTSTFDEINNERISKNENNSMVDSEVNNDDSIEILNNRNVNSDILDNNINNLPDLESGFIVEGKPLEEKSCEGINKSVSELDDIIDELKNESVKISDVTDGIIDIKNFAKNSIDPDSSTENSVDSSQSCVYSLLNTENDEKIKLDKFPFTIGRSFDFNSYAILNPKISSVHCRISKLPSGSLQITDLNSTNFVRINEEKITSGEPKTIHIGDYIRLADVILQLVRD